MPIYRMTSDKLEQIPATSFAQENIMERGDLQRLLRDQPEALEDGLFIVSEEFSRWQDSGRSIDLLGLDSEGYLTVIELKRTRTGDHAELQAIRYAAMVANLTFDQIVESHRDYLHQRGIADDAQDRICEHLGIDQPEDAGISTEKPRIILASEGFSNELTTSILWLNDNYGLDIKGIRLQPHRNGEELLVESSQIIPLPEAKDYQTQFRERENEAQRQRSGQVRPMPGGDVFGESIGSAREQHQPVLKRLYDWAVGLEQEGLAGLQSTQGKPRTTLGVLVQGKKKRLLTIWNEFRDASITFQWNVLCEIAPNSASLVEGQLASNHSEQTSKGSVTIREPSDEMLAAIRDAYREANGLATVGNNVAED